MKINNLVNLAALSAALSFTTAAQAGGWSFSLSLGFPVACPPPVVCAPAPVVYAPVPAPCPPPVVCAPRVVAWQPPVVYASAPMVVYSAVPNARPVMVAPGHGYYHRGPSVPPPYYRHYGGH